MRIQPTTQNNYKSKQKTSFGTYESSDLSELSYNAQIVAKKIINEPNTHLGKLFKDNNILVFIKSRAKALDDKINVLLIRVFDKKTRIDSFYSHELGSEIESNKIDLLKAEVLEGHKNHLTSLGFKL